MCDHFDVLRNSNLQCGIFINKNLSHQEENDIICTSRVTLNIHDAYQRELGLDTNERTFKSLGLNGCLVSDKVNQISRIFPYIQMSSDPSEMLNIVQHYISMRSDQLQEIKDSNRELIAKDHTYIERVKEILKK